MPAFSGIKRRVADARRRRPVLDHVVRTVEHYGAVKGNQQAGGATYFAFLSVFPVFALAFFAVGQISKVYPDAKDAMRRAVEQVLPEIIGPRENQLSMTEIEQAAGAVGLIGLAGVLYAGLAWLSSLRDALVVVFEEPERMQPNFVIGKLRDLVTLAILGTVLLVSVALSGVITRSTEAVLGWVSLGTELGWLVGLLAIVLGLAANTVLFFAMFRLLAHPPTPVRSLWSGAVLGAVGFEVLKQLASLLLAGTRASPAAQVFGIALIMLVWIHYFSRVVLYAAAWAHTSPAARALRNGDPGLPQGPQTPPLSGREHLAAEGGVGEVAEPGERSGPTPAAARWAAPFAAGSAATLAAVAVLRRARRR